MENSVDDKVGDAKAAAQFVGKNVQSEQPTSSKIPEMSRATGCKGLPSRMARRITPDFGYPQPERWNELFYGAAEKLYNELKKDVPSEQLLLTCEALRSDIEKSRNNSEDLYGQRINYQRLVKSYAFQDPSIRKPHTLLYPRHTQLQNIYAYAAKRAVSLETNDNFVDFTSTLSDFYDKDGNQEFTTGVRVSTVIGKADNGKQIYLTGYTFIEADADSPLAKFYHQKFNNPTTAVRKENGKDELAIMNHGLPLEIPNALEQIHLLIDKARAGDTGAIPRIHWWYVHAAPIHRRPGGVAEMLVHTLCKQHGLELPAWKEDVAPSIEVLLEPNEKKFCENYHHLFEGDTDMLQQFFQKQ